MKVISMSVTHVSEGSAYSAVIKVHGINLPVVLPTAEVEKLIREAVKPQLEKYISKIWDDFNEVPVAQRRVKRPTKQDLVNPFGDDNDEFDEEEE